MNIFKLSMLNAVLIEEETMTMVDGIQLKCKDTP